jgi:phage terminase large subunit
VNAALITPEPAFDWKNPDYGPVWQQRVERLRRIRANPDKLPALLAYYAAHPVQFVADWAVISDPRQRNRGLPTEMPLVPFPRQIAMLEFTLDCMRARTGGLIEKSRDEGVTTLLMCLAATLCLFGRGVVIGIGSRKESAVDAVADPNSVMAKARFFLNRLPLEFRGGWDERRHSAHMRITFPQTGSAIIGEAGDQIGRGARSTLFLIDEAAFLEHPQLIEASLASNTDCRIDVSTPNGRGNAFAVKRFSGKFPVFTLRWTDDPRKDAQWYQRQVDTLDPVTLAQEVDLSYDASIEGILIPASWAHASVGAAEKLGIEPSGARIAALDVADEGKDKNALAGRHGILLEYLSSWSGKGSNIHATTVRAINACAKHNFPSLRFDSDGLGAGVRGDAQDINAKRRAAGAPEIAAEPFRGSAAVFAPDDAMVEGRLNRDYFSNEKAQSWWALRLRFQATYRAVVEGLPYDPDGIISIDPNLPELQQLLAELVQPTYSVNAVGKIVVDKVPDGAMSPNLADAVMICYSPQEGGAYFATVAAHDPTTATGPRVASLPKHPDNIFTVLTFTDDAVAAVLGAASTRGNTLWCLDWDLRHLGPGVSEWAWDMLLRLEAMHESIGAAHAMVFVDDASGGYTELLQQRGFPVDPLPPDFPLAVDRAGLARAFIQQGHLTLTEPAMERCVCFRGSSRNFLREVLTTTAPPESSALAQALSTAVLVTFRDRAALSSPQQEEAAAGCPIAPPPAPSMWMTETGIWLPFPPPPGFKGATA